MGKRQVAGKKGYAAAYVTRTQAIKKLQVSIRDFRRLCILKGVYPRDPKKTPKQGKSKTYYHKKDILYMLRDPILGKFRQFKTYLKKFTTAKNKKEFSRMKTLLKNKPTISLDHLVKERYPSFMDSLRDLDDPLTMIHLFACLPSGTTSHHRHDRALNCTRLSREFQNYLVQSHAIRKAFISIKGYYIQAEIRGQKITWIMPHKFPQNLPADVDFRVMLTFLDFYESLLKFVNFKLYHDAGLAYPPAINSNLDRKGLGLHSMINKRIAEVDELEAQENDELYKDSKIFASQDVEFRKQSAHTLLFQGLKFFLSRETPQEVLELLVLSLGGEIVMEDPETPDLVNDSSITHQIIDRKFPASRRIAGREYIQPQWVFDCMNVSSLLPIAPYEAGASLPPHLSPFVDDESEGYVPKQREILAQWVADVQGNQITPPENAHTAAPLSSGPTIAQLENEFSQDLSKELQGVSYTESLEISDDEFAENIAMETEAETSSESNKELAKSMMTKKNAYLYSKMQHGINRKKQANQKLVDKRKQLENAHKN